jgi:YfiH family protein
MATGTSTVALPAPFRWEGDHIGADLGYGARALFTTRRGGVSRPPFDTLNLERFTGDDDPAALAANYERLAAAVGVPVERFAQGRQVHGAVVQRVRDVPDAAAPDGGARTGARGGAFPQADGQATALPEVACVVLTADCMPVALASPGAVAMVHAGWRGLAAGVLEEGVRAVRELGGSGGPLVAAIGPCAGGCCYEVGDDVRAALGLEPLGAPATIDLAAVARERLGAAGVDAVHDVGMCTMCSDPSLLFSHRRDGGRTGRQGGVAWRVSA